MAKKEVKKDVTERVKTFEDALRETGRPSVPEFSDVPEDLRDYFKAQYKMVVIAEALNEGWKADWSDGSQKKWYPWFYVSSSGFAFYDACYCYSHPAAGDGSRLCFKTEALARYAGKQFVQIWDDLLRK
ncbi:hypothetical protein SAMN05216357_112108 [Porphyromonadaceae bacterium KH3CP3RA]|nr:hypothetical protein SAMN05216357_112108 [Porphyromonadaceae bacterium KH3CP3RA]